MKQTPTIPLRQRLEGIDGWLSDSEARFLYETATALDVSGDIVEIGSWKGKSTICLAAGVVSSGKKRKVYAVDPHEGIISENHKRAAPTLQEFVHNIRRNGFSSVVKPIVKTSGHARELFAKPVAFLFIDGLHDYDHASEDFHLWYDLVVPGGVIAFHDAYCGYPGVSRAVRDTLFRGPVSEIGVIGSVIFGVKGHASCVSRFLLALKQTLIRYANMVYQVSFIPAGVRFFFAHRIVKSILMNRYTLFVLKNNHI